MTTIKIKPSHPSQGEFVLIDKKDFDPEKHELLDGESLSAAGDTGDGVPTMAELIASHNLLLARKDELDDLELRLSQRGAALDDREIELRQRADQLDDRERALSERELAAAERETANQVEAERLASAAVAKPAADKAGGKKQVASTDDAK